MKKLKFFIVLLSMIGHNIYSQDDLSYKTCVKEFYRLLFSNEKVTIDNFSAVYSNASTDYEVGLLVKEGKLKNKNNNYLQLQKEIEASSDTMGSLILLKMRNYKKQLTQNLNYEEICKLVDISSVYCEGEEFSMILELSYQNDVSVYFEINKDHPKQILYIWLPTGESVGDLIQGNKHVERLQRPGIINDHEGSTVIREKPDKSASIVGRFIRGEVFYYTPIGTNDWWPVYNKDGGDQIGYIPKNKILKYSDFPTRLKKEVKKQRGGC